MESGRGQGCVWVHTWLPQVSSLRLTCAAALQELSHISHISHFFQVTGPPVRFLLKLFIKHELSATQHWHFSVHWLPASLRSHNCSSESCSAQRGHGSLRSKAELPAHPGAQIQPSQMQPDEENRSHFFFLDWDLRPDKWCFEDNNRQFVAKKFFFTTGRQPCNKAEEKDRIWFRDLLEISRCTPEIQWNKSFSHAIFYLYVFPHA